MNNIGKTRSAVLSPFTLLELLVVMSIISILAAISLPGMRKGMQKAKYARWMVFSNNYRSDDSMVGQYNFETDHDNSILNTAMGSEKKGELNGPMTGCSKNRHGRWSGKKAIYFGGDDNSYVEIKDEKEFSPGNSSFTVIIWFKPTAKQGNAYIVSKGNYLPSKEGWSVVYYSNKIRCRTKGTYTSINNKGKVKSKSFDFRARLNTQIEVNKWYMATIVIDSNDDKSTITSYLDDKLIKSKSYNGRVHVDNVANLVIGRNVRKNYAFKGYVDELSIFKRTLSEREIKNTYEIGRP